MKNQAICTNPDCPQSKTMLTGKINEEEIEYRCIICDNVFTLRYKLIPKSKIQKKSLTEILTEQKQAQLIKY